MLMPSFVDMQMDLRPLDGGVPDEHGSTGTRPARVGDTSLFACCACSSAGTSCTRASDSALPPDR